MLQSFLNEAERRNENCLRSRRQAGRVFSFQQSEFRNDQHP